MTLTKSDLFHLGTLLENLDFNDSFSRFRSKTKVKEEVVDLSSSEEDDVEKITESYHKPKSVLLMARPKTGVKHIPGSKRLSSSSNDFLPKVKKI